MAVIVVAVSGGVDSVVLLDMLAKTGDTIVVAHVDHGIRTDSAADARFVRALAKKYQLDYVEQRLHLGAEASEDRARKKRYDFLFSVAKKYQATVATAHHQDDLVETIAINFHRGTGWRGLMVLNRSGITRPLLTRSKADIYDYALQHHLEWVEDSTNRDARYLRNRVRGVLHGRLAPSQVATLATLRSQQIDIYSQVKNELTNILSQHIDLRYLLNQVDSDVAIEILSQYLTKQNNVRLQRPQLERALLAVKTAQPGTVHHVGNGIALRFTTRGFSVEVV